MGASASSIHRRSLRNVHPAQRCPRAGPSIHLRLEKKQMPADCTANESSTRRSFLKRAAAATGVACASHAPYAFARSARSTRISQVFPDLNHIHKWDMSNGDTWDPFWADDGNLYAFNCDGRGFGPQGRGRNLAFNQLAGKAADALTGSQVNSMDAYGKSGLKGPDGATWKACGQECIDGVFYAFVSRNTYGSDSGDRLVRQTAVNSSLIKSTDRGLTWTRSADENYARPMWPGPAFGAPFFVHYGQNGGSVTRDDADRYAYASSTNGFWNDGDSYILGRVERAKLSALRSSDWSYYPGGDGHRNWSKAIADAKPILSSPAHCGQGPICFIPALDLYLTIAWYNTETLPKWFEPNRMQYDFYQAEHPWGPWTLVNSFDDSFISAGHMYGPSLCARFQERSGSEVRISMFTSGCPFKDIPTSLYKMWEIPLVLRTGPVPASTAIAGNDPRVSYTGAWHGGEGALASLHPHTRYSNSPDAAAEFNFHGTGVALIAEKGPEFGAAEIYLDGQHAASLDLRTENFPRICSVEVFSTDSLRSGNHTIRIVNKSADYAAVEMFRVIE
jgi:hypothetical protein